MNSKRVLGCCILIVIFTLSTVVSSLAGTKSQINKNWRGLAIKGYDPVAFFKEGTPVEGSKKFEFKWKNAKRSFSQLPCSFSRYSFPS